MASFGETLKRERELRDISLREIADATKINLRYLEALEQNRFDRLPGGVFNKGFIRAYATFIGVDDQTMIDQYLQESSAGRVAPPPAPEGRPAGVHRPAALPKRRATPPPGAPPSGADGASPRHGDPARAHAPAATELARAVQAICEAREADRDAGPSRALSGIVWLVLGTGLLFIALFVAARILSTDRREMAIPGSSRGSSAATGVEADGGTSDDRA